MAAAAASTASRPTSAEDKKSAAISNRASRLPSMSEVRGVSW